MLLEAAWMAPPAEGGRYAAPAFRMIGGGDPADPFSGYRRQLGMNSWYECPSLHPHGVHPRVLWMDVPPYAPQGTQQEPRAHQVSRLAAGPCLG